MTPEQSRTIATERLKRLHDPELRAQADAARVAMRALGDQQELGWLALGHASEALQKGDTGLAEAELEAAFAGVSPELDDDLWLGLLTLRGMVCAIQSNTAGQLEAYCALLDAADRAGHAAYQVAARGSLALSTIRCGIDADPLLVEALQLLPALEDPIPHEAMLRTTRLYSALERDIDPGLRADELLAFLESHPRIPDRARSIAHVWVASWLVDEGRVHPALDLATPLLRDPALRMGQEPALVRWVLARAHLELGEVDRAEALAVEALSGCPSGRYYTVERRLHELLSRIAEARGDVTRAMRHERRAGAISLAHEQHHLASAVSGLIAHLGRDSQQHRELELAVRNQSLTAVNDALEREVQKHRQTSAELKHAQQLLVRSAHAAGMSSVATDVLHNIGNALNGLGVSAQLLQQELRRPGRSHVFERLIEHLDHDVIDAARLRTYLQQVADSANMREQRLLDDVQKLTQAVDHIAAIVASQQEMVRLRGVNQRGDVRTVVREVLALSQFHPQARALRVCALPDLELCTDTSLVAGALDALLRNAFDAVEAVSGDRFWVELRAWEDGDDVVFSVTDGGDGVADGLRDRLFQHGVTDKPGHDGFGLHRAALAARALDGVVTLWPPASERGACFILRIRKERRERPIPSAAPNADDG